MTNLTAKTAPMKSGAMQGHDLLFGGGGTRHAWEVRSGKTSSQAETAMTFLRARKTTTCSMAVLGLIASMAAVRNDILYGGAGADVIDGGGGIDTASYFDAQSGVRVRLDMAHSATFTGDAVGDNLISIENLYGSQFDDNLTGSGTHNVIWGGGGNDVIFAGHGNDDVFGGEGEDRLNGNAGIDRLIGGRDQDTFVFQAGSGSDMITDFEHDAEYEDEIIVNDKIDLTSFGFSGSAYVLHTHGRVEDGNAVLDFGNGDVLTIHGTLLGDIQDHLLV